VAPEVSRLKGRFGLLATNPPFGTGKYRWNKGVEEALGRDFLGMIGLAGEGQTADPALLFLFRNLDLLADGGGLAIVLPDGIIQARDFVGALEAYERSRGVRVSMEVLVSLPVATFSLGGTVAKTSFLVLRRNALGPERSLFVGVARHIGFLKRGNRRVQDPGGNDADRIATSFAKGEKRDGERSWRSFDRLVAGAMVHRPREGHAMAARRELRSLVQPVREFVTVPEGEDNGHFHVSILDVDETGLIEVTLAARNRPVTKALRCEPGDIVVSCLNPKIWRVACIPNVPGTWSCSPEFTVLRPRNPRQAWAIYVGLHRGSAMQAVQALAGGTSSSRQRVEKGEVLGVEIFVDDAVSSPLREHAKSRTEWYLARLREWRAYRAIHEHDGEFKT